MDRVDRLRQLLDGAACAVCDASVPADGIRVVAHRDDLVFAELRCEACGSVALGMVSSADVAEPAPPGTSDGPPITAGDVARMRDFLASYRGDVRTLVDPPDGRPTAGRPE
jgi:hypothetical protein